ncbi:16S rRNA pseudouridine(516) synthase [Candidatus Epulonipiscium fishelsonii]|uniref:16S rRNA pseudouridine(516) synthase n=1 Tax=Candidatus Epulonipiscium fishelsonii TaxID=77094 RepID=A0ACC8XEY8_9FIRM|nr:16S rRNA pseudouridine(516) synthase [Epulopiscium sp. SCG-B11WGA-EpuloA1]ONI43110.1 16S rRNA pseudouridine(516) synthase [Epulopiscium sp. SCG-B05WGA-EpuloA1]
MRLDKYLSHIGIGTRTEVKKIVSENRVRVNEKVVNKPNINVNSNIDKVYLNNKLLEYKEFYYFILNKPQGVITATEDNTHKTVMDLLKCEDKNKNLSPVGRLDKDTEGLLILTNDGQLSHNLLSPKKHVSKTYYLKFVGNVVPDAIEKFKDGIEFKDGTRCLPAKLEFIDKDECLVTIEEGKFHQVKRMMHNIGGEVVYLKRIQFNNLKLPSDLNLGEYRELTNEELNLILNS